MVDAVYITDLPHAAPLAGGEAMPAEQGPNSVHLTVAQIAAYVRGDMAPAVASVAALKAMPAVLAAGRQLVALAGYHGPGSGGGGPFVWDPAVPVGAGDDVRTVAPGDGSPGAWRRLSDGGVSVRHAGARGTWDADDTAAFGKARDAAGPGGVVVVPPGVYRVHHLALATAGQTWLLHEGAVIKQAGGANGNLLWVTGTDIAIRGRGVIDGNGREQSAGGGTAIIAGGAHRLLIEGTVVRATRSYGARIQDSDDVTIRGARFVDTGGTAVEFFCTDADVVGALVDGVQVDRSGRKDGGSGIKFSNNSRSGRRFRDGNVANSRVHLHPDGTGLCVEFWGGGESMGALGNRTLGGRFGVSFNSVSHGTMVGNTARGYNGFGLELAQCAHCTMTGNTAVTTAAGTTGALVSMGGTGNSVTANTLVGNHHGVHVFDTPHPTTVTANPVTATRAGAVGIYCQGSPHTVIEANPLDGGGVGGVAILLSDSSHATVGRNPCRSWASHWLQIVATAADVDHIQAVAGDVTDCLPPNFQEQNGHAIGPDVALALRDGYPGHFWGGAQVLRDAAHVHDNLAVLWSTEPPEGKLAAGVGSLCLVGHPAAGMPAAAYLKAARTEDGTGWLPVQLRRVGPSAGRPTGPDGAPLAAGLAGHVTYWDTDLGCEITWSGRAWVNALGQPVDP